MFKPLLRHPLLCPFCYHKLEKPITLECGHVLCKGDYEDLQNLKFFDESLFKCPECQNQILEDKLSLETDMDADIQSLNSEVHCFWCEKKLAKFHCLDNCDFLCYECKFNKHDQIVKFKHHSIIEIDDIEKIKFLIKKKCEFHPNEEIKLYCEECKFPICYSCSHSEAHKTHNFSKLNDLSKKKSKELSDNHLLDKKNVKNFEEIVSNLKKERETLNQSFKESLDCIEKYFFKLTEKIKEKKKEVIKQATQIFKEKIISLEKKLYPLCSFLNISKIYDKIFEEIKNSNEEFFLTQNFDLIFKRKNQIDNIDVMKKIERRKFSNCFELFLKEIEIEKHVFISDEKFEIFLDKNSNLSYYNFEDIILNFTSNSKNLNEIETELLIGKEITQIKTKKNDMIDETISFILNPIKAIGKHKLCFRFTNGENEEKTIDIDLLINKLKPKIVSLSNLYINEIPNINFSFGEKKVKEIKFLMNSEESSIKEQFFSKERNTLSVKLSPFQKTGVYKIPFSFKLGENFHFCDYLNFKISEKIDWKWDPINIGRNWIIEEKTLKHTSGLVHSIARSTNIINRSFEIKIKLVFACCGFIGLGIGDELNIGGSLPQKNTYLLSQNGNIYWGTELSGQATPILSKNVEYIISIISDFDKKDIKFSIKSENVTKTLKNVDFGKGVYLIVDSDQNSIFQILE